MKPLSEMKKGEASFAREFTRQLLVGWADMTLRRGFFTCPTEHLPYIEIARERNWVSKKDMIVIGAGFTAAAGFLKR